MNRRHDRTWRGQSGRNAGRGRDRDRVYTFTFRKPMNEGMVGKPDISVCLLFYKWAPLYVTAGRREEEKVWPPDGNYKKRWLPLWCRTANTAYRESVEIIRRIAGQLKAVIAPNKPFRMKLQWRLVVGLSTPAPYEVGLLLHRFYCFPYIPGSAVKGIARLAALCDILSSQGTEASPGKLERLDKCLMEISAEDIGDHASQEWRKLKDTLSSDGEVKAETRRLVRDFLAIFGSKKSRGKVSFFDAIPDPETSPGEGRPFVIDIMNVHFKNYYGSITGGSIQPPADTDDPNPVTFIAVEGLDFLFFVKGPSERSGDAQRWLNTAKEWVKKGVEIFGVGAKTSVGYGAFSPTAP